MYSPFSSQEIEELRALFPVTQNWIYLNHAAVAPISLPVAAAIQAFTQEALQQGYTASAKWSQRVEAIRASAARLINGDPRELAFVKNTSHGISLIARGFTWKPGDEVITCETEFPSNIYPWMALEKQGVILKKLPICDGKIQIELLNNWITPQTRLLTLSSVQYGNGYRLPLNEITELCRQRGLFFLLDGIQSLGAFPLDVSNTPVDAMAADAHKWLLGPEGIGLFYLRTQNLEKIEPALIGWNSVAQAHRFDRINFELRPDAARFEEGSPSTLSLYALGAAIDLLLQIGVSRIAERILALTEQLSQGLQARGLQITSSVDPRYRSGIITFRIPGEISRTQELERFLFSQKIYAAFRQGSVRFSPHFYNTEAEIDQALQAIDRFLAKH